MLRLTTVDIKVVICLSQIGIQTEWQRDMMLQQGHESGVSIDATFGTNE
jgi:hypothetical protein